MGKTAWPLALGLLTLLKPATQDTFKLKSPTEVVYAECGKDVLLNCEVASPKKGLQVKHMEWSLNGSLLCNNTGGNLPPTRSTSSFHCHYNHGHLTLRINKLHPPDGGNSTYLCKVWSNKGMDYKVTTVKLKEPNKCLRPASYGSSPLDQTPNSRQLWNAVGSVRHMTTLWCISLLLVVILK